MGRSTHGLDMCTSLNNTTLLANLHCSKLFLLGTVSLALGPCCRHLHRRTKKRAGQSPFIVAWTAKSNASGAEVQLSAPGGAVRLARKLGRLKPQSHLRAQKLFSFWLSAHCLSCFYGLLPNLGRAPALLPLCDLCNSLASYVGKPDL